MAVAHDFGSESHTGTTGSTSQASFSWSHNPVGVPSGVLVFVWTNADADLIVFPEVTYDNVLLIQVAEAIDSLGEPGRCTVFFLGSGVPTTDPATVAVTRTNNATVMYAVCVTVTAAGNTEVTGVVTQTTDGTLAEVNVDDGSPGSNSLRYAAGHSGLATSPTIGANSTLVHDLELAATTQEFGVVRETVAGQGSRPVGFVSGTSDDRAFVYLAVREVKPGPAMQRRRPAHRYLTVR